MIDVFIGTKAQYIKTAPLLRLITTQGLENLQMERLMDHGRFLTLLPDAEFVITGGGSLQEEAYYLDTPCLVLRSETERLEGLGGNGVLDCLRNEQE